MEAMKRSGLSAASDGVLSKRTGAAPTRAGADTAGAACDNGVDRCEMERVS